MIFIKIIFWCENLKNSIRKTNNDPLSKYYGYGVLKNIHKEMVAL